MKPRRAHALSGFFSPPRLLIDYIARVSTNVDVFSRTLNLEGVVLLVGLLRSRVPVADTHAAPCPGEELYGRYNCCHKYFSTQPLR